MTLTNTVYKCTLVIWLKIGKTLNIMGRILVVSQRNLTEKVIFLQTEEENEIAMTIFGPFQVDGSVNAHILRWAHV